MIRIAQNFLEENNKILGMKKSTFFCLLVFVLILSVLISKHKLNQYYNSGNSDGEDLDDEYSNENGYDVNIKYEPIDNDSS